MSRRRPWPAVYRSQVVVEGRTTCIFSERIISFPFSAAYNAAAAAAAAAAVADLSIDWHGAATRDYV